MLSNGFYLASRLLQNSNFDLKEFIDLYKQSLCNPKMTYYIKAKYIKRHRHIKDTRGSGKYYDENVDFHLKNESAKL